MKIIGNKKGMKWNIKNYDEFEFKHQEEIRFIFHPIYIVYPNTIIIENLNSCFQSQFLLIGLITN